MSTDLHLREQNPGRLPDDEVDLLSGGENAFPRMVAAIEGASQRVHLEVYTFERGFWGNRFLDVLSAAAQRGVRVRVTIDGFGSSKEGRELVEEMKRRHIAASVYNPLSALLRGKLVRNHRKVLIVDDEIAFVGGINVADEYATMGARRGWADLALEIRGPSARALAQQVWTGHARSFPGRLRIWLSGIGGGRRLRLRYVQAFQESKERIFVAHAYFLPDAGLLRALRKAAKRGVQVTLLLAGRSDVLFALAATQRLYVKLLESGIRIFEWQKSILHAKAAVVDGKRFLVGSFNLDPLSLSNLEALVELTEPRVALKGENWIQAHVKDAKEVTLADCERHGFNAFWWNLLGLAVARAAEWFARFAALGPMKTPPKR